MNKIDLSEEIAYENFLWSAYTLDPQSHIPPFLCQTSDCHPAFSMFSTEPIPGVPILERSSKYATNHNYKRPKIIMCFPKYSLLVLADLRYISFRAFKSTFCVSLLKSQTQRLSIEPYRNLPKRHAL